MNFIKVVSKYVDVKLLSLLALFYAVFDVVYIVKQAYIRNFIWKEPPMISWGRFLFDYVFFDWVLVVSFMSLVAISTKTMIRRKFSWRKIFAIHIVLSLFIGLFIRGVGDLYSIATGAMATSEYNLQKSLNSFFLVLDLNFLIYFAMIFIIYSYYYLGQVRDAEQKQAVLETQLVNARMRILTSQLRPHFLFNTLNCISSLTEIDFKQAQNTIADLSEFLRRILYGSDAHSITLKEELKTLDFYLNILRVRFSENLIIEKNIDPNLLNEKIPALLIQPLIENAVKHGYSHRHLNLKVILAIYFEQGFMYLKIENNGKILTQNIDELTAKGIGLSNIRERLKNLYGTDHKFTVRNKRDLTGVETIIGVPLRSDIL